MKKETPHLDFYHKCLDDGLPYGGLCACADHGLIDEYLFELFEPTDDDIIIINSCNLSLWFWGAGLPFGDPGNIGTFTPLRQTIILFMAALNNEL
jgi:hypothetical protein